MDDFKLLFCSFCMAWLFEDNSERYASLSQVASVRRRQKLVRSNINNILMKNGINYIRNKGAKFTIL